MHYNLKDDRERIANKVKERIAYAMYHEGFITKHQCEEFQSKYAVTFRTKGWFGHMLGKLFGEPDENSIMIDVVRLCGAPDEEPKQKKFKVLSLNKEREKEDVKKEADE